MRICLLTDAPRHPLLAATTALLEPRHRVESLDPDLGTGPPAGLVDPGDLADVYLLKAHTPRALALAHVLERYGAPVVNPAPATELCQDRTRMAETALRAGLPFAPTRSWDSVASLAADGSQLRYPAVVKSRRSRRRDLVARVDGPAQLRALADGAWHDEPVVTQDFAPNDGWDHKLWVVGGEVFTAMRPSPLGGPPAGGAARDAGGAPRPDPADLAHRVGAVFGLDVYGVDLLDRGAGQPLIVDVNAFPGVRGQAGAPRALAALALRTGGQGGGSRP